VGEKRVHLPRDEAKNQKKKMQEKLEPAKRGMWAGIQTGREKSALQSRKKKRATLARPVAPDNRSILPPGGLRREGGQKGERRRKLALLQRRGEPKEKKAGSWGANLE